MTYTKSNSIFKKMGALVMALGLTCALAVSASAVSPDYDYDVNLSVPGLPEGHNLDFFDVATVENDGNVSTVTIPVVEGEVFGVTGNIVGAAISDADTYAEYTVDFDAEAECIVITCPESVSADDFYVGVTFTIETDRGHMPATGYVTLEAAI